MDEILNSATGTTEETEVSTFATIDKVYDDGVTLIFDGTEEATDKHYKCNTSVFFSDGDRVKIAKDSGTYIVEYVVGNPMAGYPIPSGGTNGQFFVNSNGERKGIWLSDTVMIEPSSGETGQVLTKTSNGYEWTSRGVPTSGTTGYVLTKTSSGYEWAESGSVPSTGTTGYVLTKTATGCSWQSAPTELPSSGTAGYLLRKTSSGCEWASYPTINGSGTSTIGFFGTTATSKKTISKASTSATLAQTITVVNNILTALNGYGLITSI